MTSDEERACYERAAKVLDITLCNAHLILGEMSGAERRAVAIILKNRMQAILGLPLSAAPQTKERDSFWDEGGVADLYL